MKPSFYFVIWIVIYPLLSLIGNEWIDRNAFLVALIVVYGLSYVLNRLMPETLAYERRLEYAEIMNEVYTSNVEAFRRRLSSRAVVDFVTAVYFGATFVVTLYIMLRYDVSQWLALVVFGFLAVGTVTNASKMQRAAMRLRRNPVPQESVAVAEEVLGMNYAAYYEARQQDPVGTVTPVPPGGWNYFLVVSVVFSVICGLLGVAFVVYGLVILAYKAPLAAAGQAIIMLLYGSLAAYYGVKDTITSLQRRRK